MFNRELLTRITDIEEVKKIEVEILDAFVSFCEKNNLKYFLAYGTLLGAARHKGFIPWDDDIDVTMPRPDYQKLLELWPKEDRYTLLECNRSDDYTYPFAKICDAKTYIQENNVELSYDMGIYIDIFPIDAIHGTKEDSKHFLRSLQNLEKCRMYSMMPCKYILKSDSKLNITRKLLWKILKNIGPHRFSKHMNRQSQKYSYSADVCGGVLCTRYPDREIYPLQLLEETTLVEFAGKQYVAPAAYDTILTICYGDYMQLPPEEERVLKHNFKAWRCQ